MIPYAEHLPNKPKGGGTKSFTGTGIHRRKINGWDVLEQKSPL
jgi:hypothetical protein